MINAYLSSIIERGGLPIPAKSIEGNAFFVEHWTRRSLLLGDLTAIRQTGMSHSTAVRVRTIKTIYFLDFLSNSPLQKM